jgi:hypothetical protein
MQNLTASTPLRCAIASIGNVDLSRVALAGTFDYASKSVVKYNSSSEANIIDTCNVLEYIKKKTGRRYLAYVQQTGKNPSNDMVQQWQHEINSGQYNSRGMFPRGKQIIWPSQPLRLTSSESSTSSQLFIESALETFDKHGVFAENEIQRQNAIAGRPINHTFAREWVKRMLQSVDQAADMFGLNVTTIRHGDIWVERKPLRSNSVGYASAAKTDGFDVSTSIEVPPNPSVPDISNGDDNGRGIPLINAQLNASMQLVSKFNISDDLLVSGLSTFIYALASISGINATLLMSEFTIIRPLEIVLPSLRPPSSTNSAPPLSQALTQPEQLSIGIAVPIVAVILGAILWETLRRRHRSSQQAVKELVLKSRQINIQNNNNEVNDVDDATGGVSHSYELTTTITEKLSSSNKGKTAPIEVDTKKKKTTPKKKKSLLQEKDTPGLFKRASKVDAPTSQLPRPLSTASVLVDEAEQKSTDDILHNTHDDKERLDTSVVNEKREDDAASISEDEYSIDDDEENARRIEDQAEMNITQTFRRTSEFKPTITSSSDAIVVKSSQDPSPNIGAPISPAAFALKRINSSTSGWFSGKDDISSRSPRVAPEPSDTSIRSPRVAPEPPSDAWQQINEPTLPSLPIVQPNFDIVKPSDRKVPEPVEPQDTIQGAADVLAGHLQMDSETALLPIAARISLQTKGSFPSETSGSTSISGSTAGSTVQVGSNVDEKDAFVPPPLFRRTNLNLAVGTTNIQTAPMRPTTSAGVRSGPMGVIQKTQQSVSDSPLPLRRQVVLGKSLPSVRLPAHSRNPITSVLHMSDSATATPADAWSPARHFGYISRDSSTDGTPAREANAFFEAAGAAETGRRRSVAGFSPSSPGSVLQATSPTSSKPPLYKHLHQPIVFARASADEDISDDDEEDEELTVPASPAVVSAQPSPATFTRQRELRPVTAVGLHPSPRTQTLERYALESLEMAAGGVDQIGTFLGFKPNPLLKRNRGLAETVEDIAGKAEKRAIAMAPYKSSAVFQFQQRRPTTTFKRSKNQEDEGDDDDDDEIDDDGINTRYSRASTEELVEEDLSGLNNFVDDMKNR